MPSNPFGFGKRCNGASLELAKFFAHGFAVITNNNCKNPYSPALVMDSGTCVLRTHPGMTALTDSSLALSGKICA